MNKIAEIYQSIPKEVLSILVIGISLALFVTVMLLTERPVWQRKNKKSAMRALNKLKWWNYKELKEAAEKSPLPEVREAAREKNKLGIAIHDSLQYRQGLGDYPEGSGSGGTVKIEPYTLGVYRYSNFLGGVVALIPDDVRPSCGEAADYKLELTNEQDHVGNYTDGSWAYVATVKGTLMHNGKIVWVMKEAGSAPPTQKYWGSGSQTGTAGDPTVLILEAVKDVEKIGKRARKREARAKRSQ